ncbi:MAG: 4Fe-4S dicluster domain-containing protein [Thermocladium sp.]|jgi:Fe-S oxidoreductase
MRRASYDGKRDILEESPKYVEWRKEFEGRGSIHVRIKEETDDETLKSIGMPSIQKIGRNAPLQEKKKFFASSIMRAAEENRAFKHHMDACTHCGLCIDKCPEYLGTRDPVNSPVGRGDLVRSIYRRLNKLSNGLLGKEADEETLLRAMEDVDLDKIWTYYYQCTECRRCSVYCPMGIDQGEVTRTVRQIFVEMGMIPEFNARTIRGIYETGNNMYIKKEAAQNVLDFVIDEMREETGKEVRGVMDAEKADVLLLPSSTDFFSNIGTLKGEIAIMNELGLNWTFDSRALEVANFGLFEDEAHLRYIGDNYINAALRRKAKLVVFGECGHGWRAFKNYVAPRLEAMGIDAISITQLTAWALKKGRLRVDKKVDAVVTYHDPCNLARAGDLLEEPRLVLKGVVKEFRERVHNREKTLCCGAGGGLLTDELMPLRVWAGWPSVYDSLKTGAQYMIAPCSIDKAQFPVVINYHKAPIKFKGVSDFVYAALYGLDVDKIA